ncbi:MAG: GGDEF domain-containing protein [Aquificae bacterium]|nr:GGDEF domain-containing protein [Aquificota bacterium]
MIKENCIPDVEESVIFLFNFLKKKRYTKKDFYRFLDHIIELTNAEFITLYPNLNYPSKPPIDIKNFTINPKKNNFKFQDFYVYSYKFKHPVHFNRAILFKRRRFSKKEQEFLKSLFSFWDFVNFERKQKEKLKKYVYVDVLTGLYNRYFLENVIPRELKKVERYNQPLSVLFLDIDNFKYVNDLYGHDVGDEVLKIIGKIFKENIRKTDIPIRYGGDEFIIFLPFTPESSAIKLAEKIKSKISQEIEKKLGIYVTLSISVLEVKKEVNLSKILKKLDSLLYTAKEKGKDTIVS